jgi:hypothetical protein
VRFACAFVSLWSLVAAACGGGPASAPVSGALAETRVAPPPYVVLVQRQVSPPTDPRLRYEKIVEVPSPPDREQLFAVVRAAEAEAYRQFPNLAALLLRVVIRQDGIGATLAVAVSSADGHGWTGDGRFGEIDDRGRIEVDVSADGSVEHYSLDRAEP